MAVVSDSSMDNYAKKNIIDNIHVFDVYKQRIAILIKIFEKVAACQIHLTYMRYLCGNPYGCPYQSTVRANNISCHGYSRIWTETRVSLHIKKLDCHRARKLKRGIPKNMPLIKIRYGVHR